MLSSVYIYCSISIVSASHTMQKNTTQHDLRLHSDDVINHLVSLHQRPKENALERRQNVNVGNLRICGPN